MILGERGLELSDATAAEEMLARTGNECRQPPFVEDLQHRLALGVADLRIGRKRHRPRLGAAEKRQLTGHATLPLSRCALRGWRRSPASRSGSRARQARLHRG